MVETEGPSSNLRSRGKKTPIPCFALTAQFQKTHEAKAVTHKISGVAQEYRHLIKGPGMKIWGKSFANELGQLAQGIGGIEGKNTVILLSKLKSLLHHKRCRLLNLQGWTRRGQVPT